MALLEYISRYRGTRTQPCKKHPTKLSRLALVVSALISLILIFFLINSTYCHQGDWPRITLKINPDNFIADRDGSLYLAHDRYIYKYSSNLTLLTSTQPTVQSPTPSHEVLVLEDSDNTSLQFKNKLLRIVRSPSKQLDDLKSSQLEWDLVNFMIDYNEELHVVASSFNTSYLLILTTRPSSSLEQLEKVINFQDGNQTSVRNAALAGMTRQAFALPAMGLFRTNVNQATRHIYLELTQVLPYNRQLSDNLLLYQYIYTFNRENHTYFVLNDIRKLNDHSINTVRLARICRDDLELRSYTEIPLSCNHRENLYAQAAYLDDSRSFDDINLHVISEDISKKSSTSFLCSYSLKHIQDVFNKAISDCHEGFIKSLMLNKLHPITDKPLLCQKNPTKDWCTSATNPYIDGSNYPVREYNYILLEGLTSPNFFYSTFQGKTDGKEVYFIGTKAGQLTKITADQDPLYSIDLYDGVIENYKVEGEKISNIFKTRATPTPRNARYSISGTDIFATTYPNKLHKIPTEDCQFYTSCGACLTVRDPLKCVWCSDKCTSRDKCLFGSLSIFSCPPVIDDFYPRVGPTTGNTTLTIIGDNFGTSPGRTRVKVANQECRIENISNTKISCDVPPQNEAVSSISVEVDDDAGYLTMRGNASSQQQYRYAKVSIYGYQPVCVSKVGATNITILGDNLNAGSSRKVLFAETECRILNVSHEQLNCSLDSKFLHGRGVSGDFLVTIDKTQYTVSEWAPKNFINLPTKVDFDCDDSTVTLEDQAHEHDGGLRPSNIIILLILISTSATIVIYFVRYNGLSQLRKKVMPKSMIDKCDIEETKMNFRGPNGAQFMQQDSTSRPSESLSGLIKLNDLSGEYFNKADQFDQDKPLMQELIDDEMMQILRQEKILVERNRLTLGHVLGSGQFGRVYKGFLKVENAGEHATVAVKTLHNRCHWDDSDNHQAFLEEGLMMKDFNHENVLALIGVTFDSNGLPMVITPFMLYGDLRSYISDEASSPTVKELIEFGIQVAKGMAYLSNLKFVHRDLAARNCMLDENLIVKVADFGLSRDIYERDYYSSDNKKAKLPVKWMAIESLERSIYSTKTDVWSFGVLLWELMTRGVVPYPDVDNFDLFSYLKEGRRMLRPRYCPMSLYKIMLACWNVNPEDRPTFDELVVSVSNVIVQLQEAKDSNGQQKVSRDETYCDVVR